MRTLLRCVALGASLCALVLGTACASSTDAPEPRGPSAPRPTSTATPAPPPLPEDDFARSMLVAAEELGAGWENRAPEGLSDPLAPCFGERSAGVTGEATTDPPFLRGEAHSLSERIAVFETPEQAAAEVTSIDERITCTVRYFNEGRADDSVLTFSGALASRLNVPALGDARRAYRLQLNISAAGRTGPGSVVTLFIDFTAVQEGRIVYTIAASSVNRPLDAEETARFAEIAGAKITP